MTTIKVIKKEDGYAYQYTILDKDNRTLYVRKSGFKTPEEALETAKKSYNHRMSIKNNTPNPIHIEEHQHTKTATKKENLLKRIQIKNLNVTDGGYKIISAATAGVVIITAFFGCCKIVDDVKNIFPEKPEGQIERELPVVTNTITKNDCDFRNLHIVIRSAEDETNGVAAVTSDMLSRIGVSNEIVNKGSDISQKVNEAISNNQGSNIVVINLEAGLENKKSNKAVIIGDFSNMRTYPSDILASCINASLNDYALDPIIRSGESTDGIWRKRSYLETELANNGVIDNVSQLTIDLPLEVGEDTIIRNDAAASIVEGIIRWTTLDVTERYRNIYHTAEYSDTVVTLIDDYGISMEDMSTNSDIDMRKGVRVGNTILVGKVPMVATNNTMVYNPCTTTDSSRVETLTYTYEVQSGDTVTKIANMYGGKIDDIIVPSGNINNIHIGDILYIPTCNLYETHPKSNLNETKQL